MAPDTVDTRKLWELIGDIRFAMFTSRHGEGHLHSRPMTTQNGAEDRGGVLWFFMSRSGQPVADLATVLKLAGTLPTLTEVTLTIARAGRPMTFVFTTK